MGKVDVELKGEMWECDVKLCIRTSNTCKVTPLQIRGIIKGDWLADIISSVNFVLKYYFMNYVSGEGGKTL